MISALEGEKVKRRGGMSFMCCPFPWRSRTCLRQGATLFRSLLAAPTAAGILTPEGSQMTVRWAGASARTNRTSVISPHRSIWTYPSRGTVQPSDTSDIRGRVRAALSPVPLASLAGAEELATGGTVEHRVAQQVRVTRIVRRRPDDDATAAHALAHVIVGLTGEHELDAVGQEGRRRFFSTRLTPFQRLKRLSSIRTVEPSCSRKQQKGGRPCRDHPTVKAHRPP